MNATDIIEIMRDRDEAMGALKYTADALIAERKASEKLRDKLDAAHRALERLEARASCAMCDGVGHVVVPDSDDPADGLHGDDVPCDSCHGSGIRCYSPTCKSHGAR